MSFLKVEKVWKEYEEQIVLEDISFEIERRAFLMLVGPSGCGKTTFLRMLLGQETPTRGQILMQGAPLAAEPGPDRGVVFQRYSVFPHLTALGNVMLGAELAQAPFLGRLFGKRRRIVADEARALLAQVGLAGSEDKYPAALSGGMQQRLALAQALMRRPKVLLLDEPFGALDPGIRAEIQALMQKLWHKSDLTVVMVTHDLREAFRLGTRVLAFERPRNRPEERARYGAVIAKDIAIWPPRVAGSPKLINRPGRDDPANTGEPPGRPAVANLAETT
jgi:NitT/TauT family transport system ATP-binding protein